MARHHRAGGEVELHAARMGELLRRGTVSKAYRAIDNYTAVRLRRWLRFKHKVRRRRADLSTPSPLWYFGPGRLTALGHYLSWLRRDAV